MFIVCHKRLSAIINDTELVEIYLENSENWREREVEREVQRQRQRQIERV